MANNIDTTTLTALITEFRRLQAKDSITPESLGSLLQRITDTIVSLCNLDDIAVLNDWRNSLLTKIGYIFELSNCTANLDNIYFTINKQSFDGSQEIKEIFALPAASNSSAGCMTADQVSKLENAITIEDLSTINNNFIELDDILSHTINDLEQLSEEYAETKGNVQNVMTSTHNLEDATLRLETNVNNLNESVIKRDNLKSEFNNLLYKDILESTSPSDLLVRQFDHLRLIPYNNLPSLAILKIHGRQWLNAIGGYVGGNEESSIDLASYLLSLEDRISALEKTLGNGSEYDYYPETPVINMKNLKFYTPYAPIEIYTATDADYGIVFKIPSLCSGNTAELSFSGEKIYIECVSSDEFYVKNAEGVILCCSDSKYTGIVENNYGQLHYAYTFALCREGDELNLYRITDDGFIMPLDMFDNTRGDGYDDFIAHCIRCITTVDPSYTKNKCWIAGILEKENGSFVFRDLKKANTLCIGNSLEFFANEIFHVSKNVDDSIYVNSDSYLVLNENGVTCNVARYTSSIFSDVMLGAYVVNGSAASKLCINDVVYNNNLYKNFFKQFDVSDVYARRLYIKTSLSRYIRPCTVAEAKEILNTSRMPSSLSGDYIFCIDGYISLSGEEFYYGATTITGSFLFYMDICTDL